MAKEKAGLSALEQYEKWKEEEAKLLAAIAEEAAPEIDKAVATLMKYADKNAREAVLTALREAGLTTWAGKKEKGSRGQRTVKEATAAEVEQLLAKLTSKPQDIEALSKSTGLAKGLVRDAGGKLVAAKKAATTNKEGTGAWLAMFSKV